MEVFVPWSNTWRELPSLPLMDPEERIDQTRIFSLQLDGALHLYLLGGSSGNIHGRQVWRLDWSSSHNGYIWAEFEHSMMGELHY